MMMKCVVVKITSRLDADPKPVLKAIQFFRFESQFTAETQRRNDEV